MTVIINLKLDSMIKRFAFLALLIAATITTNAVYATDSEDEAARKEEAVQDRKAAQAAR